MVAGHPELLALLVLVLAIAALFTVRALRQHRPRSGRRALLAMGVIVALYGSALVGVSLTSRPITLQPGQAKRFCGFYFDCHVGVAVAGDRTTPAAPGGDSTVRHVVTLEMRSDARAATLGVTGVQADLLAADGRRFRADPGAARLLEERLPPGGSYRRELVFDVPGDARPVAIDVRTGWWVDRLIERFIIGDEDSFLHPRTTLALGSAIRGEPSVR